MKDPLIIGNWKSHKNTQDVKEWFARLGPQAHGVSNAEVVLCPPFPLLPLCRELLDEYQLKWKLGAQDVSQFPEGKYTGDVSASLLKDFVDYVLIGHSERRSEHNESDDILFEKVKRVREVGLTPIFFVQGTQTPIPPAIDIVAYEPVFAIGTGHPDTPEDAEKVGEYFKKVKHVELFLYGGSVDDTNVNIFMSCSSIDGTVPGTASLDPIVFARLIQNA